MTTGIVQGERLGLPKPIASITSDVERLAVTDALSTAVSATPSTGAWGYTAGTSGTVILSGGKRVRSVSAHATSAATLTINGGATITIPANTVFQVPLDGQITDATFVFTSTDAYFIDFVT